MELDAIVTGLAQGIAAADGLRPIAIGARSGKAYAPGIGPHSESRTLDLALTQLSTDHASPPIEREVPYPTVPKARCDLCLGTAPDWLWCVEVKMLRMMGDNGKPNDNMLMHILSPYPQHRSALTDCAKLVESGLSGRKAIVIFGYDYERLPMEPAIDAFEALARRSVVLGDRMSATFEGLVHPVHERGRVFGWELLAATSAAS